VARHQKRVRRSYHGPRCLLRLHLRVPRIRGFLAQKPRQQAMSVSIWIALGLAAAWYLGWSAFAVVIVLRHASDLDRARLAPLLRLTARITAGVALLAGAVLESKPLAGLALAAVAAIAFGSRFAKNADCPLGQAACLSPALTTPASGCICVSSAMGWSLGPKSAFAETGGGLLAGPRSRVRRPAEPAA
jgi:hypothetical protein